MILSVVVFGVFCLGFGFQSLSLVSCPPSAHMLTAENEDQISS